MAFIGIRENGKERTVTIGEWEEEIKPKWKEQMAKEWRKEHERGH